MKYMPIFIDLCQKRILLVGAGQVALRRARQLIGAGACLTVVAPQINPEFKLMAEVELLERPVQAADVMPKYRLVIVATDNNAVNTMISNECERLGVLCNRCDDFVEGSFVCGCTLARGPIISSTMAGGVPEVAKFINNKIENLLTPGLIGLAALLIELRPSMKSARPEGVRDFIASLVNDETIARFEREGCDKLREEIMACL